MIAIDEFVGKIDPFRTPKTASEQRMHCLLYIP